MKYFTIDFVVKHIKRVYVVVHTIKHYTSTYLIVVWKRTSLYDVRLCVPHPQHTNTHPAVLE